MSLELRITLEMTLVFVLYMTVVFLLPHIVLNRYLAKKPLTLRFLICVLTGNFYIIYIVFALFFLKIPGKISLILFTVIPAFLIWRKINAPHLAQFFHNIIVSFTRFFLGEAHVKTIFDTFTRRPFTAVKKLGKAILHHIKQHFIEWILLTALIGFNFYYYSYGTIHKYVYGASDLVVHQKWISRMSEGVIFDNGIYPFGFHNVIWFFHECFGIDLTVLLRCFGVTEMAFIYIMLYVLLRKILKSRYTPILGLFLFSVPNLFDFQATMRYQWSLPQEFAMVFLYPCAYFLIDFFERKKKEIKTENDYRKNYKLYAWIAQYKLRPSTKSLILFGMSFCLTFGVHFYITIIAVFLCLAVAIAYFPVVFHYRYFLSIAFTGILSLFIAIAPMAYAYTQGVSLQGSLQWALDVIKPNNTETNDSKIAKESLSGDGSSTDTETKKETSKEQTSDSLSSSENNRTQPQKTASLTQKIQKTAKNAGKCLLTIPKTIFRYLKLFYNVAINLLMSSYTSKTIIKICMWCLGILLAASFLLGIFFRKPYFRNLFFAGLYYFFIYLLACAPAFNLPSLMDMARSRIFIVYATPLLLAACADLIYAILARPFRYHRVTEALPVVLTLSLTVLTVTNRFVKPLNIIYSLQSSGEIVCNTKIINEYPEKSWTIVSPTNNLELIKDYGWHYEVCDFLGDMMQFNVATRITIPTKYVFIYIEKKPLNYGGFSSVTQELSSSGSVSIESAAKRAVFGGSEVYYSKNRHILESKLFYWAKAFEEKYPKEFQVFYEDDSFICYRIVQNEYNLYNFAINYGYNY